VAIAGMVVLGGTSITFAVDVLWLRIVAGMLMLSGSIVVLCIKTCPDCVLESSLEGEKKN